MHHIDEQNLRQKIEQVSNKARSALEGLSDETADLKALVERIAHRDV